MLQQGERQAPDRPAQPSERPDSEDHPKPGPGEHDPAEGAPEPDRPTAPDQPSKQEASGARRVRVRITRIPEELPQGALPGA